MCRGGPSGEEAVTLLKGNKGKYRALVTDINLVGRIDGWEVARLATEIDPAFRRSQQHSPDQAVCASAACYRRFPASQCWHTDNVMPPWRPLFHLADSNAIASTASHPTMTREATAPADILAFSFVV
jgi:hypothetical protein